MMFDFKFLKELFPADPNKAKKEQKPSQKARKWRAVWKGTSLGISVTAVSKSEARAKLKRWLSQVNKKTIKRLPIGTVVY